MMRFALALITVLCAAPAFAQERVFRASSIDVEQNDRLDSLESRVTAIETKPVVQPQAPSVVPPKPTPAPVKVPSLVKAPTKTTASKPYAVITIETIPGCDPCNRWKAREAKELRAQGWTVVEAPLTSSSSAPFFRICIGDRCFSYRGFMSHGVLRSIIGNVQKPQASRAVQSSRYSTEELRAMIHAKRPGGWTGAVYADVSPRSFAKQHLVGPQHGFSWDQVNGLTQDEALILHDLAPNHGNQIFPTRGSSVRQPAFTGRFFR